MHFPTLIASLALATSVLAGSLQKLEVTRVFVPEECELKTQNGDMLSMHYVRHRPYSVREKGIAHLSYIRSPGRKVTSG